MRNTYRHALPTGQLSSAVPGCHACRVCACARHLGWRRRKALLGTSVKYTRCVRVGAMIKIPDCACGLVPFYPKRSRLWGLLEQQNTLINIFKACFTFYSHTKPSADVTVGSGRPLNTAGVNTHTHTHHPMVSKRQTH